MGLAASQARLLTITSRKSRAQFENMRMSHQKLALSRALTDISNEYQKSLEQTNLYYDFYGVNSTDTPLTYDMLMAPSSINDYTPTLITNNQGQVVLSAPYAAAALAAGIPMEGLGCQPSSVMRDAFILALAAQGIITQNTAESITAVNYNQGAGLGNDNLIAESTTTGDYDMLMEILGGENYTLTMLNDLGQNSTGWMDWTNNRDMALLRSIHNADGTPTGSYERANDTYSAASGTPGVNPEFYSTQLTIADLLNGTSNYYLSLESKNDAIDLAKNLGINFLETPVKDVVDCIDNSLKGIFKKSLLAYKEHY